MRTKKILCLIDGIGFGGAQRQIIMLVKLLRDHGYNADLACYHERHFYDDFLSSLKITPILLHPSGKLGKIKSVKKLIVQNKYDVVITYLPGPNTIGCILKLMGLRFKLIVSDRTTYQKLTFSVCLRSCLYKLADYVVPNSYSQAEFLLKNFKFLKSKIVPITNATDLGKFHSVPYITNNTKRILIAGRIHPQKNIPNFIKALELLKSNNLPIKVDWYGKIGKEMDGYNQMVMAIYEKSDIKQTLTFHPGSQNIISLYQNCDVFCLPSLYEGFPNVICEAMCCGKPILCSDVCDNPQLVKDGINGFLFDPKDPKSIADSIFRFCKLSDEEIKTMGIRSREMAENVCSTETFVNKYINLIES